MFGKKVAENKMFVFISVQLLSETFLIQAELGDTVSPVHSGLHVKCRVFLSDFYDTRIFLTVFQKYTNIQFHKNSPSGSPVVACRQTNGRTDGHDEANSCFWKFCEGV
jgi:hypothetical protein